MPSSTDEVGGVLVAALEDGPDDLVEVNIVEVQGLGGCRARDRLPQLLQVDEVILQELKHVGHLEEHWPGNSSLLTL